MERNRAMTTVAVLFFVLIISFIELRSENCDCKLGDPNNDGGVNLADAVYTINYVFKYGPAPVPYAPCAGDPNADCACNLADAVYLINYIFRGGLPPSGCTTWTANCGALIWGEHVYGGRPGYDNVLERRGYTLSYDSINRVPKWVAYHVIPDYLNTPPREGSFASFRTDPDIPNPVVDGDYDGLYTRRGYDRGHLAPYAVMGGDRDGDGLYAESGADDAQTLYECNRMSNIAPQRGLDFNRAGGLWYKLERWEQDILVDSLGKEIWVFAGCIFGKGEYERVGPEYDIGVPSMFFKIVIQKPEIPSDMPIVLAFLFPHQRSKHGEIENFLVTVDVIEALTGLDFFNQFDDTTEALLEDTDTWVNWQSSY